MDELMQAMMRHAPIRESAKRQIDDGPLAKSMMMRFKVEKEPRRSELSNDMWPMTLAQLADLESTDYVLRRGGHVDVPLTEEEIEAGATGHNHIFPREVNPLPGMKSSIGRMAWGLGENMLADRLTRGKPKLRMATKLGLAGIHALLAANNTRLGLLNDKWVKEGFK